MLIQIFLKGIVLGLAIAAPVGPIGILCIRRTLSQGWWTGFVSGLGAATADALYGSIAGFGLVTLSEFLVAQRTIMQSLGGLFLLYLGGRTVFAQTVAPPSAQSSAGAIAPPPPQSRLSAYGSALALTLTNPATILSFVAMFAGLGLGTAANPAAAQPRVHNDAWALILGVFLGSALWWLFLCSLIQQLRQHLSPPWLTGIHYGSGAILVLFGLVALLGALGVLGF